jgi:hypothetical protein
MITYATNSPPVPSFPQKNLTFFALTLLPPAFGRLTARAVVVHVRRRRSASDWLSRTKGDPDASTGGAEVAAKLKTLFIKLLKSFVNSVPSVYNICVNSTAGSWRFCRFVETLGT